MTTARTPCECQEAGWCERHQCEKTPLWFELCQTRPDVFQIWEEGHGPGQVAETAENISDPAFSDFRIEPGFFQKAMNFGEAVVRHAVNGGRNVSESVYQQRLAICRGCPLSDMTHMVCRSCGCRLEAKARWESENCPQSRWPPMGIGPEAFHGP